MLAWPPARALAVDIRPRDRARSSRETFAASDILLKFLGHP